MFLIHEMIQNVCNNENKLRKGAKNIQTVGWYYLMNVLGIEIMPKEPT